MGASVNDWLDSLRFACEVQSVISMRLIRLCQGGPQAAAEAHAMVAEKLDALADAEVALLRALAGGETFLVAAERACEPVRKRVHANSRRLLRAPA
jgi:ABC-type hemin transport system ATPase subunit